VCSEPGWVGSTSFAALGAARAAAALPDAARAPAADGVVTLRHVAKLRLATRLAADELHHRGRVRLKRRRFRAATRACVPGPGENMFAWITFAPGPGARERDVRRTGADVFT
jgi:hypothetical protein